MGRNKSECEFLLCALTVDSHLLNCVVLHLAGVQPRAPALQKGLELTYIVSRHYVTLQQCTGLQLGPVKMIPACSAFVSFCLKRKRNKAKHPHKADLVSAHVWVLYTNTVLLSCC